MYFVDKIIALYKPSLQTPLCLAQKGFTYLKKKKTNNNNKKNKKNSEVSSLVEASDWIENAYNYHQLISCHELLNKAWEIFTTDVAMRMYL